MTNRLSKLRRKMAKQKTDAMIVTKPENITYLTGFTGSNGVLLVTKDRNFLLTDWRYKEQVGQEAPEVELYLCKGSGLKELANLVEKLQLIIVGFESHALSFAGYQTVDRMLKKIKVKLEPLSSIVEDLRLVKDAEEIKKIAKAARIGDKAFKHILSFIKPGLAEREVALELEYFMRKRGAAKASFDIIVASGTRSSMPHARTGNKKLKAGDFVKLDFGAVYDGYCSDMTRTAVLGKTSAQQKKIHELVLEAQKLALGYVKAGKPCREVDGIARNYFKEHGYTDEFGHNLGHGVGLEVHEAPGLGPKSKGVLKENMVATVEPGLYFPGWGGVRIEDLVLIQKDGCKVLTKSSKKLIEI